VFFKNDAQYLYILLDVLGCQVADGEEYFGIEVDVDRDKSVTPYTDTCFRVRHDLKGDLYRRLYTKPLVGGETRVLTTTSEMATGFGPSFNDTRRDHRIWELALNLEEIGADPTSWWGSDDRPPVVRMGLWVRSTPEEGGFVDEAPEGWRMAPPGRDFADLLEISLATQPKFPETLIGPVFLGVGFETTAPTIAAAIISARDKGLHNFFVFSAHKLIPPALSALLATEGSSIDGLILPGHVSVIIGTGAYLRLVEDYHVPCAVAGFEPVDILQAVHVLVEQLEKKSAHLENCYPRAVTFDGNKKAQQVMETVFKKVDALWRGLGTIPRSGLCIRDEFSAYDAQKAFDVSLPQAEDPQGCICGDILTGKKTPPQCPLYRTVCTPVDPVGPCMVSSEGTCAAFYRYHTA